MSLDLVALLRALQAQEDDLLRETLMTLCQDVRTVAAVVEQAIRARAAAGVAMEAIVPLSGIRREMRAALTHLERALKEADVPPCQGPEQSARRGG